jgi:serine phosphatase RsbU (regulator of sigma subunit)
MEARMAVAKVGKYGTAESGDSFEMIERPAGGLSFVLADGQTSGKPAKAISNAVVRKAISLLADGVRDGPAARAASDYLCTYTSGKVLSTLNILSIDLTSQTMVITRNNPVPVILIHDGTVHALADPSEPVGTRRGIRPSITEVPLAAGLASVIFTDGLTHAGDRVGTPMDVIAFVQALCAEGAVDPEVWADRLLQHALTLDQGRPADDISILVTAILQRDGDDARRLSVRMPL